MPPKGRVGLGGETNSTGEGPRDPSQEVRKGRGACGGPCLVSYARGCRLRAGCRDWPEGQRISNKGSWPVQVQVMPTVPPAGSFAFQPFLCGREGSAASDKDEPGIRTGPSALSSHGSLVLFPGTFHLHWTVQHHSKHSPSPPPQNSRPVPLTHSFLRPPWSCVTTCQHPNNPRAGDRFPE